MTLVRRLHKDQIFLLFPTRHCISGPRYSHGWAKELHGLMSGTSLMIVGAMGKGVLPVDEWKSCGIARCCYCYHCCTIFGSGWRCQVDTASSFFLASLCVEIPSCSTLRTGGWFLGGRDCMRESIFTCWSDEEEGTVTLRGSWFVPSQAKSSIVRSSHDGSRDPSFIIGLSHDSRFLIVGYGARCGTIVSLLFTVYGSRFSSRACMPVWRGADGWLMCHVAPFRGKGGVVIGAVAKPFWLQLELREFTIFRPCFSWWIVHGTWVRIFCIVVALGLMKAWVLELLSVLL
jgi:hypothetical protein